MVGGEESGCHVFENVFGGFLRRDSQASFFSFLVSSEWNGRGVFCYLLFQ